MPERIEHYYICHCCGCEGTDPTFTQKRWVPARKYDESGEKYTEGFTELDLCAECSARFWKISDKLFAEVEYSEFKIEVIPYDGELGVKNAEENNIICSDSAVLPKGAG